MKKSNPNRETALKALEVAKSLGRPVVRIPQGQTSEFKKAEKQQTKEERDETIIELILLGLSARDVAKRVNTSDVTVLSVLRKNHYTYSKSLKKYIKNETTKKNTDNHK